MPKTADLSYYKPINKVQEEFHASKARHKLLLGGYGAGKSYPAIHESIFHALTNPGHSFYMFRNTWESVIENIEEDVKRICEDSGLTKKWIEKSHDLILVNDCRIRFRPLSLSRAKLKGIHMCGFLVDDPDVGRYQDTISFLFSRLRNPPNVQCTRFQSIVTANLEGRDWLWTTYIKDKEPGGDEETAYWISPTTNNPTLPENYISDMMAIHSQEWIDRYIHCNMDAFVGLIYHNFAREIHHMDSAIMRKKQCLCRILSLDVGLAHATAVLEMFTDGENIYVPREVYKKGMLAGHLGMALVEEKSEQTYHAMIIDPSSAKTEQTSGTSVKALLKQDYNLFFKNANNNVDFGINVVNDLIKPAVGPPKIFIDTQNCPNLTKEIEIYRWKEPTDLDTDNMSYEQKPVKRNDDAVDALRYGCCFLKKKLHRRHEDVQAAFDEVQMDRWEKRFEKLRMYKENPSLRGRHEKMDQKLQLRRTYQKLGFHPKKIKGLLSKST